MAVDLSKIEERKKIIDRINSDDNKKRKATSLRQFRCYSDNLDQYVQERLLQSFSKETFLMMPVISTINLVSRITDQSASIYNIAPKRDYENVSKEQESILNQIYKDAAVDNKMLRANRFYKLQNQTHVYIKLVEGKLTIVPLLNHNIDVIPDDNDPEKAFCYIIANFDRTNYNRPPYPYNQISNTGYRGNSDAGYIAPSLSNTPIADTEDYKKTVERYTFWSNDYNFVCDGLGTIIDEDEDISNPLEMIPIVDISQFKDFVYFVEQGSGVVEFAIDYNVALTDLMFISRLQGFAQGVVSGDKEILDKMTTIQLGPAHIIKLPNNIEGKETKLEFVNRGSDIKGSQDSIEMLLSNFLTSRGIDPKTISGRGDSNKFTSGTERLLAMIERFEASRADYDLFRDVESKIFKIIIKYINTYTGSEYLDKKYWLRIPEEAEMTINYKRPELVQGESEKVDTITKKLDAGIISKVEAIMEDRGINREMAIEALAKIKEDSDLFMKITMSEIDVEDENNTDNAETEDMTEDE